MIAKRWEKLKSEMVYFIQRLNLQYVYGMDSLCLFENGGASNET